MNVSCATRVCSPGWLVRPLNALNDVVNDNAHVYNDIVLRLNDVANDISNVYNDIVLPSYTNI